ncbi:MAG: ATP-dependent DNA helicase [Candidatus Thermoplasmatota archaeon]|jgi:DNA excision repair protein ERCC-2|nr:ATP-dependent DNA helicase [Candidatus Thermoplasmatota archaeon]
MEEIKDVYGTVNLRTYQKSAIDFIIKTLGKGLDAILQAPTGSGKTLMMLISGIIYAKNNEKKVLYLTRTNSQQKNIRKEILNIQKFFGIKAVIMQGRTNMCPMYMEMEKERDFTPESLSRMCSSLKRKKVEHVDGGCPYFNDEIKNPQNVNFILDNAPSPEDLFIDFTKRGICPYESVKYAMKDAELVVMPYAYFISPDMASTVMYNWRVSREDIVILIDEAHNLPDIARNVFSMQITWNSIGLCEKEAVEYGDPEILSGIRISDFMEIIRMSMIDLAENLNENTVEKRVNFRDIYDFMAISSRKRPEDIEYMIDAIESYGENIENLKEQKNRVPMSHLKVLSRKLSFMQFAHEERYICIVKKEGDTETISIEAFCLDPSIILEELRKSRTIQVSATIEPLWLYRNMTGFENSEYLDIGKVFPSENLMVLYDRELTTKYDEFDIEEIKNYRKKLQNIFTKFTQRTMVLFPSFRILEIITKEMKGFDFLVEKREMKAQEFQKLMKKFNNGEGILMGVMGGRLSEGIDLPGKLLELLIIVGIPFPKPDIKQRTLSSYYSSLYGNGWQYAFLYPATVKVRQAIGRLIRSRNDRGVVIIMDNRAEMLSPEISAIPISQDLTEIVGFFNEEKTR